jgi:hypothetical protein
VRNTLYPGASFSKNQPQCGCGHFVFIHASTATTALRLFDEFDSYPNVTALPQHWAGGQNPVGIGKETWPAGFYHINHHTRLARRVSRETKATKAHRIKNAPIAARPRSG